MSTIFSAYDIRGRAGDTLTVEYAWTVGKALAEWLADEGTVVVMKDTGADEAISHALVEGLLLQGRNVAIGTGDQRAAVNAIATSQAAGGALISRENAQDLVVITLFDASGATVTAESGLMAISELIDAGNFLPAAEKGDVTSL